MCFTAKTFNNVYREGVLTVHVRLSQTIRVLAVAQGVEVLSRQLVRRVVQQLGHSLEKRKKNIRSVT